MAATHTAPVSDSQPETPLAEQAYRQVRVAILRGHLAPASRLKMDDLQRATGLSNSPLREALNRLAMEGLVVAIEHRGFRVASISVSDLRDVTRMRVLLEGEALREAMAGGDDAWEARALGAYHRLERVESRIHDEKLALNDEWTERHRDFHLALLSGCGSPRLSEQVAVLFDQAERYRRLSAAHRKEPRHKAEEHRQLLGLVLARDVHAACTALEAHVLKTATNVERVLGKVLQLHDVRGS